MKIVGVINDYKEALNIEEIVKVFVIEQRIFNLLSDSKNKSYNDIDSNTIMLSADEIENIKTSNIESINHKDENDYKPLFNVRGLN